jgi:radical SAM superfamily enzyme YgiQ (UPF0313 family)
MKALLVQQPTIELKVLDMAQKPLVLGHVYGTAMPSSLARIARALSQQVDEVSFSDLRTADPSNKTLHKKYEWEGGMLEVNRVGADFQQIDDEVRGTDIVGISSHFTCESGVVEALIQHIKEVNRKVKVVVGGADVKTRPQEYIKMGADLAVRSGLNPAIIKSFPKEPKIVGAPLPSLKEAVLPDFDPLKDNLPKYTIGHDGDLPEGIRPPVATIYFSRGCSKGCDFCETRNKFEILDLEDAKALLRNYKLAGITTLDVIDDNLLCEAARDRAKLIELFKYMQREGFAWNFPNGLEIRNFIAEDEEIDQELLDALFNTGCFGAYIPIETFEKREEYEKLAALETQNKIIAAIASKKPLRLSFGVIMTPDATEETVSRMKSEYLEIREIVNSASGGMTKMRCSVFHLSPIASLREMPCKYGEANYPELRHFHVPAYDGTTFSARELLLKKLEIMRVVDPANFKALSGGTYQYA